MSDDPNIEQIIANLDRLLEQSPDKGDKANEGRMPEGVEPDALSQPEQVEEFEFVEDEDLAEAAGQAEEEAVDESEAQEGEKRRILLTPDMQVADEQILLLEAEEIPPLPEQELLEDETIEEAVIEEALAYEAVTDEVMEVEASDGESPEAEAPAGEASPEIEPEIQLASEEAAVVEIPEEDMEPAASSPEEAVSMSGLQEARESIDARALAERVCEDVLEKLREILPEMIENSVERALADPSRQPARDDESDSWQ